MLKIRDVLWLSRVCQMAWYSGRVPKDWQTVMIIHTKKKGDRRECTKCPDISFLSHPGKVFYFPTNFWELFGVCHRCPVHREKVFESVAGVRCWRPLVAGRQFVFLPVAYLGFPAPGYKVSFGAPTQHVHGSIDAKNELGIKGRRKLILPCNRLDIVFSRPVWKLPVIVTSQNCCQDLWTLEIINYLRGKNLIVSREAIPPEILVTIEHSNCFITAL